MPQVGVLVHPRASYNLGVEQCSRCSELWFACALVTAELAQLSKEMKATAVQESVIAARRWRKLHELTAERAAIQANIKIHLALAHGDDIGRGAMRTVEEYMPVEV